MHPALLATAISLPVALVVGVVVAAVVAERTPVREPVAVSTVPAPESGSSDCASFIDSLPDSFGDWARAEIVDPAPQATAAWQADDVADPIVLRCGLDRPTEFDQAAPLTVIDTVQWFEVSGADQGVDASTWYAVDRGVYVAVTVPNGSGPTPLQSVSAAVLQTLPETPLDPAPIG